MKTVFAFACAALCFAAPAQAHHSVVGVYDMSREIDVSGVVTRLAFRNPHVRIYFTVTDADGAEVEWMAEGGAYSALLRTGWAGQHLRPGDAISVHGHASRDDSPVVHMMTLTLPDGRAVWSDEPMPTGGPEAVLERQRAAIERAREAEGDGP